MGFDTQRFPCDVDEELICSICGGVLQDPIQIPTCEHAFCQTCIEVWLSKTQTCPVDRTPIEIHQLKLVPRILKNLLNRLEIKCENEGCSTIVRLEHLDNHLADCEHNKNRLIQCQKGCEMMISQDQFSNHNCIQALNNELHNVKNELQKYKDDVDYYKNEISTLQEYIRTTRTMGPTVSCCLESVENEEILSWSSNLQIARITHWGGMISTPNAVLQDAVKDALLESGCPIQITNELMENAHERHWPQGLSTLETRQSNRRYYDNFVCRRIMDAQAVIILSCDNRHMNESMIAEPGLIMMFSHGVK